MKNVLIILMSSFIAFSVNAQDTIFKNDGTEISAKVLEISKTEVKFKKTENLDGPTYTESIKDLMMIRHPKGIAPTVFTKEDSKPEPPVSNATLAAQSQPTMTEKPSRLAESAEAPPARLSPPTTIQPSVRTTQIADKSPDSDDSCDKGTQDARVYYTGKSCGSGLVSVATILVSPLIGGITAAVVAGTQPSYANLNIPKPSYANNSTYMTCYQNEAHKVKKKKVWTSFGIGAAAWAVALLIFL